LGQMTAWIFSVAGHWKVIEVMPDSRADNVAAKRETMLKLYLP